MRVVHCVGMHQEFNCLNVARRRMLPVVVLFRTLLLGFYCATWCHWSISIRVGVAAFLQRHDQGDG